MTEESKKLILRAIADLKRALQEKPESVKGRVGQAPYGWTVQPQTPEQRRKRITNPLVRNEREQDVISIIQSSNKNRVTYAVIADRLNRSGYRTRSGALFTGKYVADIAKKLKEAA